MSELPASGDVFEYFDEAYFEGGERGTAYLGYRENASKSATFLQIAQAIQFIFRPKRCLEIGCATGAIVNHLNRLGVETHGIDVSKWAVENRLHPNVIEAPAHTLPFPDGHFDLVYSAHAIEHIPVDLKDASFRDISRVAKGGQQFHMLPLIGDGPYTGDPEWHVQALKADPTHVLLYPRSWWIDEWSTQGWRDQGIIILLDNDTAEFELSGCQFSLSNGTPDPKVAARAFEWNRRVTQRLFFGRKRSRVLSIPTPNGHALDVLRYPSVNEWRDLKFVVDAPLDVTGAEVYGIVDNQSREPINLRLAVLCEGGAGPVAVLESWHTFQPGKNLLEVFVSAMEPSQGTPDLTRATEIYLGGTGADRVIVGELALKRNSVVSRLTSRRPT